MPEAPAPQDATPAFAFLCGVASVAALLLYFLDAGPIIARGVAVTAVVVSAATLIWMSGRRLTNMLVSAPLLFLLGLIICNLGQTVLDVFGIWSNPLDP